VSEQSETTGPTKIEKIAVYARVSTGTQSQSLDTQLQQLRTAAHRRDMEIALEVTEVVSGTARKLPRRDALMETAEELQLDAIMVTRLDRFGRSLLEMLNIWFTLQSAGINFISLDEGIDFSTPTGKLQAKLLAVVAEFEKSLINERTKEGREAAKSRGVRFGRPSSLDITAKVEVMEALLKKVKQTELAEKYNVSQGTIYRMNKKMKDLEITLDNFAEIQYLIYAQQNLLMQQCAQQDSGPGQPLVLIAPTIEAIPDLPGEHIQSIAREIINY
jgi:DNA invertase Pin-like site-specific DNA recombinase